MRRRLSFVLGCSAFVFILASTVVVLRAASDGPYNTGGGWCESHTIWDNPGYYVLSECWYPPPPSPPM